MIELKFLNIGILSWIVFLPLIGILCISLLPKEQQKNIKWIATAASFVQLALAIILLFKFNASVAGFNTFDSLQFIEKWIWFDIQSPSWSGRIISEYFLAVDGLSLPMIFLTALISFVCII